MKTYGQFCKLIKISASDFIRCFKNSIAEVLALHEAKNSLLAEQLDVIMTSHEESKQLELSTHIEQQMFHSKTAMASPPIRKKLTVLLANKKRKELDKQKVAVEKQAKQGDGMARTLIHLNNQMALDKVGQVSSKLSLFDVNQYGSIRADVKQSHGKEKFFHANLDHIQTLANSKK